MAPGMNGHSNQSLEEVMAEVKQDYDQQIMAVVLQVGADVLMQNFRFSLFEAQLWANETIQHITKANHV